MSTRSQRALAWHSWLIAIAVLVLYIGGARDYLLILLNDTSYIANQFGPTGIEYFSSYPVALRLIWTVNIIGGLIAPILLLTQSRWAFPVATTAAIAQIILLTITFAFRDRWAMLGAATSWFDIGIGIVTTLLAAYCWVVSRRTSGA